MIQSLLILLQDYSVCPCSGFGDESYLLCQTFLKSKLEVDALNWHITMPIAVAYIFESNSFLFFGVLLIQISNKLKKKAHLAVTLRCSFLRALNCFVTWWLATRCIGINSIYWWKIYAADYISALVKIHAHKSISNTKPGAGVVQSLLNPKFRNNKKWRMYCKKTFYLHFERCHQTTVLPVSLTAIPCFTKAGKIVLKKPVWMICQVKAVCPVWHELHTIQFKTSFKCPWILTLFTYT